MSNTIPQAILDALTKVDMPPLPRGETSNEFLEIENTKIRVHRCETLILGSGAAGYRAAVELKRRDIDVLIASTGMFSGTSACSGSDKQTLHTAGTSNRGDNFHKLSQDIGSGGAMDQDTAYIEATGSINAFSGLQYMGLPLPQDRFGAVLRYQTDHDEVGRATSCGPRTSRLMVKVLSEEAVRLGVRFLKQCEGIQILKKNVEDEATVAGILAVHSSDDANSYGLCLILCSSLVLATGGPGELYRDSVYPKHCYGSLGMAIEAGIEVCNLTESQFGIGTRRTEFPWNLSGTYVQVLPHIYSVDEEGNEHHFLASYYRTTKEMCSNIFRKGYQWPFHAERMLDFKSSLMDLAIFEETKKGRTVYMDFNRNPLPVSEGDPFSLDNLDDDVRNYLVNNEALQELPIDRLRCMNPLSIELYKMHGKDISENALPFAVNNQHMNGGVATDIWGQSSLKGCYAIGEVSGTHGATRPGGAALNAGQVFAIRVADHIKSLAKQTLCESSALQSDIQESIEKIEYSRANSNGLTVKEVREEIQTRMSEKASFICQVEEINPALQEAMQLRNNIQQQGLIIDSDKKVSELFRWFHLALTSEAVLKAMSLYVENGGGSRGARAYCHKNGDKTPETKNGLLQDYAFIAEREEDKSNKIVLQWELGKFKSEFRKLRELEDLNKIFFEKNWSNYLTGAIYDKGFVTL